MVMYNGEHTDAGTDADACAVDYKWHVCGVNPSNHSPLLFGQVLPHHLGCLLPDVRGSMGVLQRVHVHVEGHGVWRGQVFA